MWNPPTKKQLEMIPKLYAQEKVKDKKVYMKFFIGSWTWYATEFDGKDMFFGLVVTDMVPEGEWGYFTLSELKSVKVGPGIEVDRDLYDITPYKPKKMSEIKRGM